MSTVTQSSPRQIAGSPLRAGVGQRVLVAALICVALWCVIAVALR